MVTPGLNHGDPRRPETAIMGKRLRDDSKSGSYVIPRGWYLRAK